jgi:hypothetical protein
MRVSGPRKHTGPGHLVLERSRRVSETTRTPKIWESYFKIEGVFLLTYRAIKKTLGASLSCALQKRSPKNVMGKNGKPMKERTARQVLTCHHRWQHRVGRTLRCHRVTDILRDQPVPDNLGVIATMCFGSIFRFYAVVLFLVFNVFRRSYLKHIFCYLLYVFLFSPCHITPTAFESPPVLEDVRHIPTATFLKVVLQESDQHRDRHIRISFRPNNGRHGRMDRKGGEVGR